MENTQSHGRTQKAASKAGTQDVKPLTGGAGGATGGAPGGAAAGGTAPGSTGGAGGRGGGTAAAGCPITPGGGMGGGMGPATYSWHTGSIESGSPSCINLHARVGQDDFCYASKTGCTAIHA